MPKEDEKTTSTDETTVSDRPAQPEFFEIKGDVEVIAGRAFVMLFEPLKEGKPFRPKKIIVDFATEDLASADVGLFGLYIDRIGQFLGRDPVPLFAFDPTMGGTDEVFFDIICPGSLVELTGKQFGKSSGILTFSLQGPVVSEEQIRESIVRTKGDGWIGNTHVQALTELLPKTPETATHLTEK